MDKSIGLWIDYGWIKAKESVKRLQACMNQVSFLSRLIKGVRTRMFSLIIYLPCFDPCVLFCCLVFCSVSSSTERA